MDRRAIALFLTIVSFGSVNAAAVGTASTTLTSPATIKEAVTTSVPAPGGRLAVSSVGGFDALGGWALLEPGTPTQELLHYRGIDALAGALTRLDRPTPAEHPAGAVLQPTDPAALVALSMTLAAPPLTPSYLAADVTALVPAAGGTLPVAGLEGFSPEGGWGLIAGEEVFHYDAIDTATSSLVGLARPAASNRSAGDQVFPLVVDIPRTGVGPVDPAPVGTNPAPISGTDLDPSVPDPAPTRVDPAPVGGTDLDPSIPDPAPTRIDPAPVGGIDLDPAVPDPGPTTIDIGPIGPIDLREIGDMIEKLDDIVIDPPPVDPGDVTPTLDIDPPPVKYDPPPIGPVDLTQIGELLDRPSTQIDPPPVGPVKLEGFDPPPVKYDPPPTGPYHFDLDAVPALCTPVLDLPDTADTIDELRELIDKLEGSVPDTADTIDELNELIDRVMASVPDTGDAIDRLNQALDTVRDTRLPDTSRTVEAARALVERVLSLLPGLNTSMSAAEVGSFCIDPSVVPDIDVGVIDLPPLAYDAPNPCAGAGSSLVCYIPRADLPPQNVDLPNPCLLAGGGALCYVRLVDPGPVEYDLASPCRLPSNPCYIFPAIDLDPLPIRVGNPCGLVPPTGTQSTQAAATDLCYIPAVDPTPVRVDVPDPCNPNMALSATAADAGNPGPVDHCYVPKVDPSPTTIDVLDPCNPATTTNPIGPIDPCAVPVVDAPGTTVDVPNACANVGATDPCYLPGYDAPPVVYDPAPIPPVYLDPAPVVVESPPVATPTPTPTSSPTLIVDPPCVSPLPSPAPAVPSPLACPTQGGGGPNPSPSASPSQGAYATTPLGQVLVVDANVIQAYANDGTEPCVHREDDTNAYREHKDCDEDGREQNFAERILALSRKTTDDGMAFVPDVILLQEALTRDASGIADKLNDLTGNQFAFEVAISQSSDQTAYDENEDDKTDGDIYDQEKVVIKGESAVLINGLTMNVLGDGGFHISSYNPADRCTTNAVVDGVAVNLDLDQDGEADCSGKAKWKRSAYISVREALQGAPAESPRATVAVASIHYVLDTFFDQNARENDVPEKKKAEWSTQINTRLRTQYPNASAYVIAGDFNKVPCEETQGMETAACDKRRFWDDLRLAGYNDTIHTVHGQSDARIQAQYRDGFVERSGNANFRERRIDYIFGTAIPTNASHDLTCGASAPQGDLNCRELTNPDYYSDHRLLWARLTA